MMTSNPNPGECEGGGGPITGTPSGDLVKSNKVGIIVASVLGAVVIIVAVLKWGFKLF